MRDEIELLSAFSPKPQFALEGLCATSYGLDPRIMLALIGYTLGVMDTDVEASDFESVRKGLVREALSENLRKVLFIRERGMNFAGPRRSHSTFERLVCDHVVGRWHRTQERGSLHAKVILGVYKDEKGNRYGRLYVGSKNLTFSQCKEFGVVLELLPKRARKNPTFHGQLVSFFEDSLSKELAGASSLKTNVFNTVVRAVKDFELAPSIPGLTFHWQSRHDRHSSLLPQLVQDAAAAVRIDIRSPWADPALFGRLSPVAKKTPLYVVCLKDPKYSYGKRDHLTVQFDGIAKNAEKLGQQQSHAKAYLFSGASTRTLMFGSANFTSSGIGISQTPNTEVLLRWPSDSKQFRALLVSGTGSVIL